MKMRLKQILLIYMFLKLMVSCCWSISSSSSSSSSPLSTTTMNLPPELIENVKSALLPIFGVNFRPPTIPQQQPMIIPEALKQLYQLQEKFHLDTTSIPLRNTENANTVRSFLHVDSTIDDRFKSPHQKFRLKFDLTSIPKNERLTAAHIKLISIGDNNTNDKECYQRILVKDIVRPGIKGIDGPITRIIDSKLINPRKNSTITLDVYPAVIRWLNNPKSNYGLLITTLITNQKKNKTTTTTTKKKKKKMVVLKNLQLRRQFATDTNQPILLTFTDDGRNQPRKGYDLIKLQRKKRAISSSSHHNRRNGGSGGGGGGGGHHRKNERDPCRRRQMYVNFRDVGWSDWIVAPLGYDAYYCDGECDYPMPEHMNTTNHAIVQSLMNSVRPTDVPKPCCVPTQLSSMSMLYVDGQNKVILKNYKEMVVIGCGCR